jgi:DNA-binding response OmpR family regulator
MQMLVVEDGQATSQALRKLFEVDGHRIDGVALFSEALQLLHAILYDLVVIDLDHPAGDVLELIRSIRRAGSLVPILIVADDCGAPAIPIALDNGADECVQKPVSATILLAHVRAVRRRVAIAREDEIFVGDVTLSRSRRLILGPTRTARLTFKEFLLLEYLMGRPNVLVPRAELLQHVWNYQFDPGTGMLDVAVHRVRRKLATCSDQVTVIAQRGHGVMLSVIQEGGKKPLGAIG